MQRRDEFSVKVHATIVVGGVLGVISSAALVIAIFVTGSTFGQRCAVGNEWGSPTWKTCVSYLAEGKQDQSRLED